MPPAEPTYTSEIPAEPVTTTQTVVSTVAQDTAGQSSVTFVRATPPDGWLPLTTAGPDGQPSEITIWPGPGPTTAAVGNYVDDVVNVESTVLVTLTIPEAVDAAETDDGMAPTGDASWMSAVPELVYAPPYAQKKRKRNAGPPQNDIPISMSTHTFWRSEHPANTTAAPETVPITGESSTNVAIPLALFFACVLLVVAELFF